jgi:Arc/MetJ-type ribon-helix-helix transcriptional regulator
MTIYLPENLESSIQAVVRTGRFASLDDAMAEAARLLLREIMHEQSEREPRATDAAPDPLLGIWRDAADEIDEIVADAMKQRREEPWRATAGE